MARRKNVESKINEIVTKHVERLVAEIATAVRQEIASDILGSAEKPRNARSKPRRGKKLSMTCIAPGCKRRSKGPRFHFLCEEHVNTPKRTYTKWRAAHGRG